MTTQTDGQTKQSPCSEVIAAPIFVSGLRKSGTSMTRLLFDGHPELFTYPTNEFHFFRYTDIKPLTSNRKPEIGSMKERIESICNDQWFQSTSPRGRERALDSKVFKERICARLNQGLIQNDKDLFASLIASAVESTSYYQGQPLNEMRVVVKGVHQAEFLPELLSWFPDLKFIYVLRNPYGQLNSAINNMRHGKAEIKERVRIANDHRKLDKKHGYPFLGQRLLEMRNSYYFMQKWSRLYPENFRTVIYDRLLSDPETEMRSLSEWLEIEYHPCLLEVTENHGTPMKREGWSVSGSHEAGKLSTEPLTAWKQQLAPGVMRLVTMQFRDILDEYEFKISNPKVSKWRRFDRAEDIRTWTANRFLFTNAAKRMLK